MSTTAKWILAVIAAAVIGGGTVALLANTGSSSPTQVPPPTTQRTEERTEDCVIKGNISSSGEKIYHVPGQRYYNQTKINIGAGERWFCTEKEAIDAGWRKSKV